MIMDFIEIGHSFSLILLVLSDLAIFGPGLTVCLANWWRKTYKNGKNNSFHSILIYNHLDTRNQLHSLPNKGRQPEERKMENLSLGWRIFPSLSLLMHVSFWVDGTLGRKLYICNRQAGRREGLWIILCMTWSCKY